MKRRVVTKKPNYSLYPWRVKALWLFILVFGLIIIVRLFWLQVIKHRDYEHLASIQHDIYQELLPERGIIYTQDTRVAEDDEKKLFPLATNHNFYLVYAQTYAIIDPEKTVEKLNSVLDLPEDVVYRILEQVSKYNDPYEPLVHRVTEEKIEKLAELNLAGINWEKESLRYYPEKNIGSNLVGFVGWVDDELLGQYGVEGYFDEELKGKKGFMKSERDASGRLIGVGEQNYKKAVNGSDIILTIDNSIQAIVCQKLDEAVKHYDATGGTVIVTNPQTGAILAICGSPNYDPNAYNEVGDIRVYTNPAIFDAYEPGSIFKPITMAAAIDQEKLTPETIYEDAGEVKIGNHIIHNANSQVYGEQNMVGVLKESINSGAIFAMRQVGPDIFREYVEKFGFGQLTGIQLDKEVAGTIDSLRKRGEIYAATASFGQGIMVTPLQMITSYAAIANGGKLIKPYVIDQIIDPFGNRQKTEPEEIRQVISPRTATLLSGMMVQVVRDGHAHKAGVEGYYLAGKTGTAEVAERGTGEYGERTIHTFIGFGPVVDPVFVMLVRLDHPTAVRFSADSAAPVFGDIARFILNYYQVKPDEVGN